jgi:hypothetical protein
VTANRRWVALLRERIPELRVDPIGEPGKWFRGASTRFDVGRQALLSPSADPELEMWRRRTLRRALVLVTFGSLGLIVTPLIVSASEVLVSPQRVFGGPWATALAIVVTVGAIGYYLVRLARAAIRYGNGEAISVAEFAIGSGAILGYLVVAWILGAFEIPRD